MILWEDFEKHFHSNSYYKIDNNSSTTVVLFGNCQIATIGFFLNDLFQNKMNIIIVLSWFFEKNNIENFDMNKINSEIQHCIQHCDYFIYQQHVKDYGVNASSIETYASVNTPILKIPNLQLNFISSTKEKYIESLDKLKDNIEGSDFKEFNFIIEHLTSILFFNTPDHPTHYLLFMLAKAIYFKIKIPDVIVDLSMYYNEENQRHFNFTNNYIVLPGKIQISKEMSNITDISTNADYFDL